MVLIIRSCDLLVLGLLILFRFGKTGTGFLERSLERSKERSKERF
tara:strand:+ start:4210 stop:4344 length:135 start_codon:yes stop_codon:yes gene_type:complete